MERLVAYQRDVAIGESAAEGIVSGGRVDIRWGDHVGLGQKEGESEDVGDVEVEYKQSDCPL